MVCATRLVQSTSLSRISSSYLRLLSARYMYRKGIEAFVGVSEPRRI